MATTATNASQDGTLGDSAHQATDSLAHREPSKLEDITSRVAVILAATLVTLVIFYLLSSKWP